MRISDWSSDVCSSDLIAFARGQHHPADVTHRGPAQCPRDRRVTADPTRARISLVVPHQRQRAVVVGFVGDLDGGAEEEAGLVGRTRGSDDLRSFYPLRWPAQSPETGWRVG